MLKKSSQFGTPIFSGMPLEKIEKIMSTFQRRKIPSGSKFLEEGKKTGKIFWVLEGNVALQWVWEGAPRLTAFIKAAPCLLGHLEAWKDEPMVANAIAMEDLDAYIIERQTFLTLIQTHHQIAINIASYTGTVFCESIRVQHQFLFGKAEEVVARSVFFLSHLYGKKVDDVNVLDTLSTRTQIALLCGLSRRAAISALQDLEAHGVLATEGRRLKILDEKALKKRSGKGF